MAILKLSLALLFLHKYWNTIHDFGKEVWYGGIFLTAGEAEPSTTWAITAQKGETDYCHTVPQHLGYKVWIVCGGIIAIYQIHSILYWMFFSHFNQPSSAFSASLSNIKDAFEALAGSIERTSPPSPQQPPDRYVSPAPRDGSQQEGQPDNPPFEAVSNRTVGALIVYIAFLLGSGPPSIILHYGVGASHTPPSMLAVVIVFYSVPTVAAIYQLLLYSHAANKEALRKDKLRNAPLDEVNAKISAMRKKFANNDFRLKRLEGGCKEDSEDGFYMQRMLSES
ncbi:MAG: hypothetical protein Q9184_007478 [Pyrenodesmia sp. 2 TL-2023]